MKMSIKKHIRITGVSNVSWKDAIVKAIEEVSKTIYNLETVKVLEQTASIKENKITEYFVLLEINFSIDENIRKEKTEEKPDAFN